MPENNNETLVSVGFKFTDEFGQENKLEKTFTPDGYEGDGVTADFLLEQFKYFLLGAGFTKDVVDRIKYED